MRRLCPAQIRRFTFTMVELLLTITIIVMLTSLLLPSLTKAKDRARFSRWQGYSTYLRANDNLVTYYSFEDENQPSLLNHARNLVTEPYAAEKLDAPIGNGVQWTKGRWNAKSGLRFDGGSGAAMTVNCGTYQTWEEQDLTVLLSCQLSSLSGRQNLCSRYADSTFVWGFEANSDNGGAIVFYVRSADGAISQLETTGTVPAGAWLNIAGSYNSETGEQKLYVNRSVFTKSTGFSGALAKVDNAALYIGDHPSGAISSPDGVVDEVAVWNRCVTDREINDMILMGER